MNEMRQRLGEADTAGGWDAADTVEAEKRAGTKRSFITADNIEALN